MSYARVGPDSDVYVFASDQGLHCHWCTLGLGDSTALGSFAMLRHLKRHVAAGDKVPHRAIGEIRAEVVPNFIVWTAAAIRRLVSRTRP